MKIGAIPENLLERLALSLGIAPSPLVDTHVAFMMARTVMTAVKAQVFEVMSNGSLTAQQVAGLCKTDQGATEKLLKVLVHLGYVVKKKEYYALAPKSKKWMLKDSAQSLYHKMLFNFEEWKIVEHYDEYLKTGKPLDIHGTFFNDSQWSIYQNAMGDLANFAAQEITKVTPIPAKATRMLDVGGAHGQLSLALCGRHRSLSSVVLDLPAAIESSRDIAERSKSSRETAKRITYKSGDIRGTDLGDSEWDVIFMANLVHHFDKETNRLIAKKITQALRPGGYYIILDFIHEDKTRHGNHLGALLDLYFSATSQGGTFSLDQITKWQRDAGLAPYKTIWLRTVPRYVEQVAIKK